MRLAWSRAASQSALIKRAGRPCDAAWWPVLRLSAPLPASHDPLYPGVLGGDKGAATSFPVSIWTKPASFSAPPLSFLLSSGGPCSVKSVSRASPAFAAGSAPVSDGFSRFVETSAGPA